MWSRRFAVLLVFATPLAAQDQPILLKGFDGAVSVAISPDGRYLAVAGYFGQVALFDLRSPQRPPVKLVGYKKGVSWLVFDRTGARLVTAHADGMVRLWNGRTGRLLRTLKGHADYKVLQVVFAPDGKRLASCDARTIILWSGSSGKLLKKLHFRDGGVRGLAFGDGGKLLIRTVFRGLAVHDAQSGKRMVEILGPDTPDVMGPASPDGKLVATATGKTIQLYSTSTWQPLQALAGHGDDVTSLAFSPDGRWLASGSEDRSVRVWDPGSGKLLQTLSGHTKEVAAVAFGPRGRLLASGTSTGRIRLWPTRGWPAGGTASAEPARGGSWGRHEAAQRLAWSPDGTWIASASPTRTVKLWDARNGFELALLAGHTSDVTGVTVSPDGKLLVSVSYDKTIRIHQAPSGKLLRTLTDTERLHDVAFDPSGARLAVASSKGVLLWNVADWSLLRRLTGGGHPGVGALAWRPGGRQIAGASWGVTLWDAESGALLRTVEAGQSWSRVAFAGGGKLLAASSRRAVQLWDPDSGAPQRKIETAREIGALAPSPDGRWIAGQTGRDEVQILDAATGKVVRTLKRADLSVNDLAFSPDGKRLAAISHDRLELWLLAD